MKKILITLTFLLFVSFNFSQGKISGTILYDGKPVEFVSVGIIEHDISGTSDEKGNFVLENVPFGTHNLIFRHISYKDTSVSTTLHPRSTNRLLKVNLSSNSTQIDDFVVTGTRTEKRRIESPVIVNVINSQTLDNVQACNLSDGLKFQPGLRVETDCQTCNYTQLRINGLAGGYSQILINGRPIFSPLTSLYGLEQIPVNMIDRVEIIRGGGSSLYGSSAIGGTVNVITKIPKKNGFELNYNRQLINGNTQDNVFSGNGTLLNKKKNAGITLFVNQRNRELYDHNGDNFSELPLLNNTSFGANGFYLFGENQKLEVSLTKLHEYRYGGEMVNKPADEAQQAEERTHDVWMGSADYQINFNEDKSSFIVFGGWQQTSRDHFTGIMPDQDDSAFIDYSSNPPYGISLTSTIQGGFQLNHKLTETWGEENTLTLGAEYLYDDVFDEIPAYNYLIDQTTENIGLIAQSDWKLTSTLNLLTGTRIDKHNLVDDLVLSPRASLLYTLKKNTQFRLSYGSGFRAPQAFD
ncbi:MAG: TonB-dependent receptor, partial [Flavobacteriales bacterium]